MVGQVFGNADAVVGATQDHCVLQEHALGHQPAKQRQHHQPLGAEQHGAGGEPENQVFGFEVAEHAQALMHEDQQAEGRGPGHQHGAKAQQGAEDFLVVDADRMEDDDADHTEEDQEGTEGAAACRQVPWHEHQQQEAGQYGRQSMDQAHTGEEVTDEAGMGVFKGSNGL